MNKNFVIAILFLFTSCSFWQRVSTEYTPEHGLVHKMDEAYINGPYPMSMELSGINDNTSYRMILRLQSDGRKVVSEKSLKVYKDGRETIFTHEESSYFDKYGKEHVLLVYLVTKEFLKDIVEGKEVIFAVNFENNLAALGNFSKFSKDQNFGTRLSAKESVQDFLAKVE